VPSPYAGKANPAWLTLPEDRRRDLARRMAVYAAMVDRMDVAIGRVVADIRARGRMENTLIVFFGDNGTAGEAAQIGRVQGQKLSGKKGTMQECGSLVPMIVNWPAMIKKPGFRNDASDETRGLHCL
jgi:arylsulfatase A-like enzyme